MMKTPHKIMKLIKSTVVLFLVVIIATLFLFQKTEYVEGNGIVIADRYNVYSPASGEIKRIEKDFGDIVKKGETVIEIDPKETENKYIENKIAMDNLFTELKIKEMDENQLDLEQKSYENNLELLEMDYINLEDEYKNSEFLYKKGEKSEYELKKSRYLLKKKKLEISDYKIKNNIKIKKNLIKKEKRDLKNQINYYENKGKDLKEEIKKCIVKSEYEGVTIITKDLKELMGSTVNKGELLFTLADLKNLKMIVTLQENAIGKVKDGQKVIIMLDAIPYEKFTTIEGEVIKLYPQAKDGMTYNKVEIIIKGFTNKLKKDKLKEINLKNGLKGKAKIIVKEKKIIAKYLWDKLFE
ncbi:HlyD family secretion protein [Haliovirga abyssi]|uniref:HlyD family efflux transporter periplasmic adaptor subunit n=1 Tax=Haliovirga abyssi TaxID=2996794 RepID=A0AAU9DZM7_9FUSO|nr:HlyD family efflux transporter periplasmic adaptor subunit [Haliovirga abyssi]BDU49455.1 hypothetical protein HLVA_00240 [Haliovirga abyssi]